MVEKVVPKEWGCEEWIVNKEYCGKKLILKKGYRCSMHHHKKKDETFYLLNGKVLLETKTNDHPTISCRFMNPGETVHVTPNMWHRFTGIEDSEIIEFSTHHDDEDSYRDPNNLSGRC